MARYRPRYRRYRRYRRRNAASWYNKKYSTLDIARAAWRGVKYIKGLVNSEVYKKDTTASVTPNTTGAIVHLTAIQQGDDDGQRSGLSIFARSLYFRALLTMNASATNTSTRLILFRDNQQIGDSAPAITDLLEGAEIQSPLNNLHVGRFTILMDKTVDLSDGGDRVHTCVHFIKMKKHVRYNGTNSTDIQKNGLYLAHFSTEATNTPTLVYYARVGYHDN